MNHFFNMTSAEQARTSVGFNYRFQVGQMIHVVGFVPDEPSLKCGTIGFGAIVSMPMVKWSVKIITLRVVQRHDVQAFYPIGDDDPGFKHDGYVLKATDGFVFTNQYPKAIVNTPEICSKKGHRRDFVFSPVVNTTEAIRSYAQSNHPYYYYDIPNQYDVLMQEYRNHAHIRALITQIDEQLAKFKLKMVEFPNKGWQIQPD